MRFFGFILLFGLLFNFAAYAQIQRLPSENTAIIVIDVWDDANLNDYVKNSLNPFLEKAKDDGYLLINAPSQGKVNRNLKEIFDYTIYRLEPIFPILNANSIKNIVYVGYDKVLCILDKPAGAFHLKNLGLNYDMYALDSLSVSSMAEFDSISEFFFDELGITKISTNELLNADYSHNIDYWDEFNEQPSIKKLSGNKPLFVIFNNKKGEFRDLLEKYDISILEVTESQSELDKYSFMEYLKRNNISDIIYAGYYADSSILFHEIGALNVYIKKRYYDEEQKIFSEMPHVFLLEDLFFAKNQFLTSKETMSLLSNHYRDIGLTNLDAISSQRDDFSYFYDLLKEKVAVFILAYPKYVALALFSLLSLTFTLALLLLLNVRYKIGKR